MMDITPRCRPESQAFSLSNLILRRQWSPLPHTTPHPNESRKTRPADLASNTRIGCFSVRSRQLNRILPLSLGPQLALPLEPAPVLVSSLLVPALVAEAHLETKLGWALQLLCRKG
ncbi:uncharacterized protein LACBIDRAFT_305798 [Laccaria bicolor S238N-H82]|uniref:Predicted protein n=1 Tax=Laccaria bicolor (strain S238N-H82 / ATCC MYA-4686) TaxID=486041 RepID=B0CRY5_LACBS|nr:uncharacterized protein LACBIDRAFT_305798 [Laccaria bicolor S238N-H82]EDR14200.1 predicted protein [Laccaria bicolor S238N-H82]|eukprot:XP_001874759.1 predicted protein [Laccaria bicolor S238N-H82]